MYSWTQLYFNYIFVKSDRYSMTVLPDKSGINSRKEMGTTDIPEESR